MKRQRMAERIRRAVDSSDLGERFFDGMPRGKWRFWAYWAITAALYGWVLWLIFEAPSRFANLLNSGVFLVKSLGYYMAAFLGSRIALPPTSFDMTDFNSNYSPIGHDLGSIKSFFVTWGELMINPGNALKYLAESAGMALNVARILFIVALAAMPLYFVFKDYFRTDRQLEDDFSLFSDGAEADKKAKSLSGRHPGRWSAQEVTTKWVITGAPKGYTGPLCFYDSRKDGRAEKEAKSVAASIGRGCVASQSSCQRWSLRISRKPGDRSLPLALWDSTAGAVVKESVDFAMGYCRFLFGHWFQPDRSINARKVSNRPAAWKWLAVLVFYYFNGFASVLNFYGYYFLFFSSLSAPVAAKWAAMSLIMLWPILSSFPLWMWLAADYAAFDKVREWIGHRRQEKRHRKNMKAGVDSVTKSHDGAPGVGKTTGGTTQARDEEQSEREGLRESIDLCCLYFPNFPWADFFGLVRQEYESIGSKCRNTADAIEYADEIYRARYDLLPYRKGPSEAFDNGLSVVDLKTAMEEGAKAYVLYFYPAPIMATNLPVRTVCDPSSEAVTLPSYSYGIFNVNYQRFPEKIQFSFILDENVWRKRPVYDDPDMMTGAEACGDFEGIVYYSQEINKDYRNRMDPYSSYTQNDGIKDMLSYVRQFSCVWSKPTASWGCDMQRRGDLPESINSRIEASQTVTAMTDEPKSDLPLWIYTRWIQELVIKLGRKWRFKYSGARDDDTLVNRLVNFIYVKTARRYLRRRNEFDYKTQIVHIDYHVSEGVSTSEDVTRYIIYKDAYADRFKTDDARDLINGPRRKSHHSFRDSGQWSQMRPSAAEKAKRHNYEDRDVARLMSEDEARKAKNDGNGGMSL